MQRAIRILGFLSLCLPWFLNYFGGLCHAAALGDFRIEPGIGAKTWFYFGFTSDSRRLVTYDEIMGVRTWDASSGRLLTMGVRPVPGEIGVGAAWTLLNDTRLLCVTIGDHAKFVETEVPSGKILRTIPIRGHVRSVGISREGRLIAYTGEQMSDITIMNTETAQVVRSLSSPKDNYSGWYNPVFSEDGRTIAASFVGYSEPFLQTWSLVDGRLLSRTNVKIAGEWFTLTPQGLQAFLGGSQARMIDTATGKTIWTKAAGAGDYIGGSPILSADGNHIISNGEKAFLVFDNRTGQIVNRFGASEDGGANFSAAPNGRFVAATSTKSLTIWDLSDGHQIVRIGNELDFGDVVAAAPDLSTVVVGAYDMSVRVFDLKLGQQRFHLLGHRYPIRGVSVSRDGARASSLGTDSDRGRSEILWWNTETGQLLRTIDVNFAQDQVALLDDGRQAIFIDRDGVLKLWDLERGVALYSFSLRFDGNYAGPRLYLSPDNRSLIVDESQSDGRTRTTKIFDVQSGKTSKTLSGNIWSATAAFTSDSTDVLLYRSLGTCCGYDFGYWDVNTGNKVRKLTPPFEIESLVETAPSDFILTGGPFDAGKAIRLDAASGQYGQLLSIEKNQRTIVRARNRTLLGTDSEGALTIWDATTGVTQLRLYVFQDGEWLILTAEGFFAGSEQARNRVNVIRGFDATSVDQFFQSLYRPDLVREKLAGDPRGLVRDAAVNLDLNKVIATGNAPDVRIVSPTAGSNFSDQQVTGEIDLIDRGGGIGRVEWRVNGVTVGVETAPAPLAAGQPLRLSRSLVLGSGDTTIEVVAYNSANLVASLPARVSIAAQGAVPGVAEKAPQRLFVLAAGSDKYADQRFQLQYSVQDAKAMAQAFVDSGKGLYESVEVKVLSDTEVTSDKLEVAFQELTKKIRPTDVFVLYLAGHGKTVDGRYYFVPQTFKIDSELTNASINAAVTTQGISQDQWQKWLALIPARKSMILFDTCESGTLTGDEGLTKSLEQGAANDRLAQATGRSIMTASSGSTEAFEGFHGHGLFTYNVLDALGRGDGDGNGTIEVSELAAFVYAQVSSTSERVFKQRQEPQIKINLNYPLTKQTRILQDDLPLIAQDTAPTVQLTQEAQLQIKPSSGATVVRSLSPKTAVTVLKSENGWSLIASGGKPVGYVATRDLAPIQWLMSLVGTKPTSLA